MIVRDNCGCIKVLVACGRGGKDQQSLTIYGCSMHAAGHERPWFSWKYEKPPI